LVWLNSHTILLPQFFPHHLADQGFHAVFRHRIQSGLLEHKLTTIYRDDGTEKTATQVRITPKGLARLANELEGEQAA